MGVWGRSPGKNLKYHTLTLVENGLFDPMFAIAEMKICKILLQIYHIKQEHFRGTLFAFGCNTSFDPMFPIVKMDLEYFGTFLYEQIYGQRFSHVVSRF